MSFNSRQISSIIILFFSLLLLLPSCVAKKKFVAMEESRNRAEKRVRALTNDVKILEVEFNDVKNQFHYNNSIKDNAIDSINKTVVEINSTLYSKEENIEDQVFSFQVEKRRLNQLLADKDKEIRNLNYKVKLLDVQLNGIKKELTDASIMNQDSESAVNDLQRQMKLKERDLKSLNEKIEKSKTDLAALKIEMKSKDEKNEALQNQVNLLKSQFGKQQ